MFKVTSTEIEALFKEVRDSIHSDETYDFVVDKHCSKVDKEKFDAIAGTWLKLEIYFLTLPDGAIVVSESIWQELVALKNDYVNKKFDRHKMIAESLTTLHDFLTTKCKSSQSSTPSEVVVFLVTLLCVLAVFIPCIFLGVHTAYESGKGICNSSI